MRRPGLRGPWRPSGVSELHSSSDPWGASGSECPHGTTSDVTLSGEVVGLAAWTAPFLGLLPLTWALRSSSGKHELKGAGTPLLMVP